jgi:hypothetical protein
MDICAICLNNELNIAPYTHHLKKCCCKQHVCVICADELHKKNIFCVIHYKLNVKNTTTITICTGYIFIDNAFAYVIKEMSSGSNFACIYMACYFLMSILFFVCCIPYITYLYLLECNTEKN